MDAKQRARRRFLERVMGVGFAVGAGALLGGAVVHAQEGERRPADQPCPTDDLSEQQVQAREALQYTDNSPKEGQYCDNCQYWLPAGSPQECGGCSIVPGPIHPQGWCSAWVPA